MPHDDFAIRVHGVSKTYHVYDRPQDRLWQSLLPSSLTAALTGRRVFSREFHALRPISFDIRRGETVGIIGRNGSGKSTLLQTICGTLTPTTGAVQTAGRVAALLDLGSGFSPEFTGRENVRLNAAMLGLSPAEIADRFEQIAAFAELGDFIDRPVKTYSSGMVVRLAFAVITHVDADVLVIDEALAVGDVFFVQKCMRWLRAFMRRGTVLFVSHDTGSVVNLCDRAIWLHQGALVMDDTARLVTETYLQSLSEEAYAGGADAAINAIRRARAQDADDGTAAATAIAHSASATTSAPSRKSAREPEPAHAMPAGQIVWQWTELDGRSFGKGGARIDEVTLLDRHERPITSIRGGELITLRVRTTALDSLRSPIVGFIVKDRLGQALFGENTFSRYRDEPLPVATGGVIETCFKFVVPVLASGDYAIDVAIADGTQLDHVQHHWIHEAVVFRSVTDHVASGLLGLPMHDITMSHVR